MGCSGLQRVLLLRRLQDLAGGRAAPQGEEDDANCATNHCLCGKDATESRKLPSQVAAMAGKAEPQAAGQNLAVTTTRMVASQLS